MPTDLTLEGHAAAVAATLDALGATRVDLLGFAGGVGVAIELALSQPALVHHLTLDSSGLLDRTARADALAHEPRDFAPRSDGTHLLAAWSWLRDRRLWQPGYRPERACLRTGEPELDPRSLQRELLAMMMSGHRYAAARAAELQYAHESRLSRVGCGISYLAAGALPPPG